MPSLEESFEELKCQIKYARRLSNTGDDPIYYLIFQPGEMIKVKQQMKVWTARLKKEGWDVHILSLAEVVNVFLKNAPLRDVWLEAEKENPLDFESINTTLREALLYDDVVTEKVLEKIQELNGKSHSILFITDIEALHPYMRVGAIEQKLLGKVSVPTVILYPGVRTGKSSLKFLGIYPEDGNYRSIHIGG